MIYFDPLNMGVIYVLGKNGTPGQVRFNLMQRLNKLLKTLTILESMNAGAFLAQVQTTKCKVHI